MPPLRTRPVLLALGLALLTACGDDPAGLGPADVAGVYPLVTLGGDPLPYLADQEGEIRLFVVGGRVTLRADGTFRDEIDLLTTNGTQEAPGHQQASGTYAVAGSTVEFTSTTVPPYTMTLSGNTLTQDVEGFVWVYRKQ